MITTNMNININIIIEKEDAEKLLQQLETLKSSEFTNQLNAAMTEVIKAQSRKVKEYGSKGKKRSR